VGEREREREILNKYLFTEQTPPSRLAYPAQSCADSPQLAPRTRSGCPADVHPTPSSLSQNDVHLAWAGATVAGAESLGANCVVDVGPPLHGRNRGCRTRQNAQRAKGGGKWPTGKQK